MPAALGTRERTRLGGAKLIQEFILLDPYVR